LVKILFTRNAGTTSAIQKEEDFLHGSPTDKILILHNATEVTSQEKGAMSKRQRF